MNPNMPIVKRSVIAYNGYGSGLGNRMRVVLGAQSLAEHEDRSFYYVWPTGPLFGPRLSDLWPFPSKTVSRVFSRILAKRFSYENENVLEWLDGRKRKEWIWQIRTGSELQAVPGAQAWTQMFRELQPVAEIASSVSAFFDTHLRDEPFVGVMVRAHARSHHITKDASPVEWFVRKMRALRDRDPDTRFFISCDVPEAQDYIMEQVPRCAAQTSKGAYNSTRGVRSAISDLYLLASSGHLIAPHGSSFIHLAQHLANNLLPIETSAHDLGGDICPRDFGTVKDPLRPWQRTPW